MSASGVRCRREIDLPVRRLWRRVSAAVRWDPKRNAYTNYTAADGLVSDDVHAIGIGPVGVLQFATTQIAPTRALYPAAKARYKTLAISTANM